jgi:non-heme chloroperoxidase
MRRRFCLLFSLLFLTHFSSAADISTKSGYFKTSDGVRLHYIEAGSGPALVFVPGWTMPAWIWDAQIQHFSAHYHVVALDPRSQGDSEKVAEGNHPERRAQDIHELIQNVNLSPAVLVGWSLAVSDLLAYAEQFGGHDVRAYVLVDGLAWSKQEPQFVSSIVPLYRQVQVNRRAFTEQFVRSMYKKPQSEDYIQRVMAASLQEPEDLAVAASVGSVARADWSPAIRKLDQPVLITCEAAIKSMTADPVKDLVPSARVEVFEDAGHALFVDDTDRFNSILEDFILHIAK